MILKPQDVIVALKLTTYKNGCWNYPILAAALKLSVGEAHNAIGRLTTARLYNANTRSSVRAALEEFLVHGVKYAFPCERQGLTRGIPTTWAASPLKELLIQNDDLPPVWPHPNGAIDGYGLTPLYPTVPVVALQDPPMYEMLALVDSIRSGGARERKLSEDQLHIHLKNSRAVAKPLMSV